MDLQKILDLDGTKEPFLFANTQEAHTQINAWAKETKDASLLIEVVDKLTEMELKNRFDSELMRLFDGAAVAIQKRFNGGNIIISHKEIGERQLSLPNICSAAGRTGVFALPVPNVPMDGNRIIQMKV